jgi:hypothetical protein
MDLNGTAAVVGALVVSLTTLAAGAVIWQLHQPQRMDGRSRRRVRSTLHSIRRNQFAAADANPELYDGWFRDTFRCSWASFNEIVSLIEREWDSFHGPIHHNAKFFVRYHVAVCIHYLTRSGAVVDSAKVFGMGKASAIRFIDQVLDIVIDRLGPRFIYLPQSDEEWQQLSEGFEQVCSFPDACLAVDGTLIQIERPFDYEGWYCRKGWPAINVQGVVDFKRRFRSYAMRPGAENDKGVFNRSEFGKTIHQLLPQNKTILADAGYQLFRHCMTPYDIHDGMTQEEKHYNHLHSCTRIIVENAFGILKNRFRRFKAPLNQKGNLDNGWRPERRQKTASSQAARIIRACLVLHNIYIDLRDDADISEMDTDREEILIEDDKVQAPVGVIDGEQAKLQRDIIKVYLWSIKNRD